MKTIKIDIPEKLAIEVENYVKKGWFGSEEEVMRMALQDFIRTPLPYARQKRFSHLIYVSCAYGKY